MGYARYPKDAMLPPSELFTIYALPEELNYDPLRRRSDWFNIEVYSKPKVCPFGDDAKLTPLCEIVPAPFWNSDL